MLGSPDATTLVLAPLGIVSSSLTVLTIATMYSKLCTRHNVTFLPRTHLIPYEVVTIIPILRMGKPRLQQPP